MEQFYYPKTIRGILIALLDMFNNLKVERYDDNGTTVKTIDVPINFAPQEKYQLLNQRDGATTPSAFWTGPIPRLGLTLDGIAYAPDRVTAANENRHFYNNDLAVSGMDEYFEDRQPTPYDFTWTLHVRTDSMNDFTTILENILPYFNPMLSLRVKEFSFLNIERDLPVRLDGVSPEFLEPQEEENIRYVNGTINFTVQGFMYRPFTTAKTIHEIQTQYILWNVADDEKIVNTFSTTVSGTSGNAS